MKYKSLCAHKTHQNVLTWASKIQHTSSQPIPEVNVNNDLLPTPRTQTWGSFKPKCSIYLPLCVCYMSNPPPLWFNYFNKKLKDNLFSTENCQMLSRPRHCLWLGMHLLSNNKLHFQTWEHMLLLPPFLRLNHEVCAKTLTASNR